MPADHLTDAFLRPTSITFERSKTIDCELGVMLPSAWNWRYEEDRYVVEGPRLADWREHVDRLFFFLRTNTFTAMSSLETSEELQIELVAAWNDHSGFRVVVRLRQSLESD